MFLKLRGGEPRSSFSIPNNENVGVFEVVFVKLDMRKTCCLAPAKPCHELAENMDQKHYAGEGVLKGAPKVEVRVIDTYSQCGYFVP